MLTASCASIPKQNKEKIDIEERQIARNKRNKKLGKIYCYIVGGIVLIHMGQILSYETNKTMKAEQLIKKCKEYFDTPENTPEQKGELKNEINIFINRPYKSLSECLLFDVLSNTDMVIIKDNTNIRNVRIKDLTLSEIKELLTHL